MADPVTLAAAAAAIGTVVEGAAQASGFNANARALKAQARSEDAINAVQVEQARRDGALAVGEGRAAVAASGITNSGSALVAIQESAANAELDALNLRFRGVTEVTRLKNESRAERYKAKSAMFGAIAGAALGSAAKALGQKSGVPSQKSAALSVYSREKDYLR